MPVPELSMLQSAGSGSAEFTASVSTFNEENNQEKAASDA